MLRPLRETATFGSMSDRAILLGNGAIARGLLESGCELVTAYPGTPSTEILEEVIRQKSALGLDTTAEWAVNEKTALDIALAAAMCGKRAACAMKQVGLNVASDSLLSAAYTGVVGGLVVFSADDPGPHSSQTEQDSRLFALFAKVPVLDPSSPREARDFTSAAFELSERHRVPVIVRPTTRICHARQPVDLRPVGRPERPARFVKDSARWAATPRHRLRLHRELNAKLEAVRLEFEESPLNVEDAHPAPLGIIAAGAAWAAVRDLLAEEGLDVPVLKISTTFPLPVGRVERFIGRHERTLVIEEPDAAIETQIPDRRRVQGRLSGHVPNEGELTPEVIARILGVDASAAAPAAGPPPRLCPGCGHRSVFFSLRKALPTAIFSGDIGCYTLGVNQKAVDTCLDMGASITLATGFWHAHHRDGRDVPIVAVIGDSTFYHAGMPALLNAVTSGARILVVVSDNEIVAMTGAQPTPTSAGASIEAICRALGARWVETVDAYDVERTIELVKSARAFTRQPDGGVAVLVARRPCALYDPPKEKIPVRVDPEMCDGCDYCLKFCECPGLVKNPETGKVFIDNARCIDCGECVSMCPLDAIVPEKSAVSL